MVRTIVVFGVFLCVALAGLLIFAATRPDSFRVERRAEIEAAPANIHAEIVDFRRWRRWSPWETKDPAMQRSFSGAESGAGAVYEWSGDRSVGAGRMEITEATPQRIAIRLDFFAPFEARNSAEFTLEPRGEATAVTWAMQGPQPYMAKLIGTIFSMDRMIGSEFETGLAKLKTVAER